MKQETQARYEPVDRNQFVLEQVDVDQLIDENHAARNIWNLLSRMDLSRFGGEVKAVEGHAGPQRVGAALADCDLAVFVFARAFLGPAN